MNFKTKERAFRRVHSTLFYNNVEAIQTCNLRPCTGAASEAGLPGVLVASPGAPDTMDMVAVRFDADGGGGAAAVVGNGAVPTGAGGAAVTFCGAGAPVVVSIFVLFQCEQHTARHLIRIGSARRLRH